jgi:SAM-dependent methyltransferase
MTTQPNSQLAAFESCYSAEEERWECHDTKDPFTRFLRDRRLRLAMRHLRGLISEPLETLSVLVVCGGVGGEASFFANQGFQDVTNSDFSGQAVEFCRLRDPRIKALEIDAEKIGLPDASYDLVLVQDGLHHLPRPVLGLNEMIRVARRAVVILEPQSGIVASLFGREWERCGDAVNFVFRWNRQLFYQAVQSQLLESRKAIMAYRIWDHSLALLKVLRLCPAKAMHYPLARLAYLLLRPLNFLGNSFAGILVKYPPGSPEK